MTTPSSSREIAERIINAVEGDIVHEPGIVNWIEALIEGALAEMEKASEANALEQAAKELEKEYGADAEFFARKIRALQEK